MSIAPRAPLGFEHLQLAAAAGGHEVIETNPLDFLLLDEVENLVDVLHIVAGEREAQAGFLIDVMAVPESAHGGIERAFLAAELVVDLADAIERDADVGDVRRLEQGGFFRRDECAVGGNGQFQPGIGSEIHQIEKARMDHRLAAGKQQRRNLIGGEILRRRPAFAPRSVRRDTAWRWSPSNNGRSAGCRCG